MLKNAGMKQAKKVLHSFCHNSGKKARNNTGQKPKYKHQCMQNEHLKSNNQKVAQKSEIHSCRAKANLASGNSNISRKTKLSINFFKTKKPTNQKTIPRGMFGGSLNLVTYDDPQNR